MILTGNEIRKQFNDGNIIVSPYQDNQVNPNSYDLRLDDKLLVYREAVLDPKKNNKFQEINIGDGGYVLEKNNFYLGSSHEIIGSNSYVPIIHAKSGIARLGLFVHITADLIDIGSIGNITFQLYPTMNIRVYRGIKIAQVSFWCICGDIELYDGKYKGSKGPQASKSYLSFV